MSKNNIIEFEGREASTDSLNKRLQAGAQKLIHQAVEAELYVQLEQYADRRTSDLPVGTGAAVCAQNPIPGGSGWA